MDAVDALKETAVGVIHEGPEQTVDSCLEFGGMEERLEMAVKCHGGGGQGAEPAICPCSCVGAYVWNRKRERCCFVSNFLMDESSDGALAPSEDMEAVHICALSLMVRLVERRVDRAQHLCFKCRLVTGGRVDKFIRASMLNLSYDVARCQFACGKIVGGRLQQPCGILEV